MTSTDQDRPPILTPGPLPALMSGRGECATCLRVKARNPACSRDSKAGLTRSAQTLTQGITRALTRKRLDQAALDELEELLIGADMGAKVAADVVAEIKRTRFNSDVSEDEIRGALAEEVSKILRRVSKPVTIRSGVEAARHSGCRRERIGQATTTIGKLAQKYRGEGLKVMLAAGDTFRAAAVEQLKIWGERTGALVVAKDIGADAPGLAYEAFERARAEGFDVLLIDTAGRLQNKAGLMAELEKMRAHQEARPECAAQRDPGARCHDGSERGRAGGRCFAISRASPAS